MSDENTSAGIQALRAIFEAQGRVLIESSGSNLFIAISESIAPANWRRFGRTWLEALLDAGYPNIGVRALRLVPEDVVNFVSESLRSERERSRSKPLPGFKCYRGKIYAE